MRPVPDWKNKAAIDQWNREVAALRVLVRLADGTTVSLPGNTRVSNLRCASFKVGDHVRRSDPRCDDPAPLGELKGRQFSGQALLAQFLPGSVLIVHREDDTAYAAEVAENADPIDLTGDELFDPGARRPPHVVESFDDFNVRRHGGGDD